MESKMQIGEYLGRCYYCGRNVFDYEMRFIVHGELVCESCCVIKFPTSEENQELDEEEIMRLKRKDEHRERQRMLKEERPWVSK